MRYIGVHIGHDATVVVLDEEGKPIFYGQCERYSRFKNHGFELDPLGHAFPDLPTPEKNDLITIVAVDQPGHPDWRGCGNAAQKDLDYCAPNLARPYVPLMKKNFFEKSIGGTPHLAVHHHLAHIITAWCFRPDDRERLFLAYDGSGMDCLGYLRCYLVGKISNTKIIEIEDATPIPTSLPLVGLLGYNSAGKTMGLAGFMPQEEWTHEMSLRIMQQSLNDLYVPRYPFFPPDQRSESNLQLMANFYRWYMGHIWSALHDNIKRFSDGSGVVIGGGTALALETNSKMYEEIGEVIFGPPTDDSGLALGAAAFGYYHVNKKWIRLDSPSLQSLQDPLPQIGPQHPGEIAELLAKNKVVGLLRGKGEAGPRALGFRSILAQPTQDNLKRVSQDIKEREFFRPLAPIVTAEAFNKLFIGPPGEYMQFLAHCTEEGKSLCPAVCHRDNTSRPQVVYKEKDPWLHELLVEYGKLSGVECLINTSLNKARKPICNTYEDVRREMRGKDLEIICLPEQRWSMPENLHIL